MEKNNNSILTKDKDYGDRTIYALASIAYLGLSTAATTFVYMHGGFYPALIVGGALYGAYIDAQLKKLSGRHRHVDQKTKPCDSNDDKLKGGWTRPF